MQPAELVLPGRRDHGLRQVDVDERRPDVATIRRHIQPEQHVIRQRYLEVERQRRLEPVEIRDTRSRGGARGSPEQSGALLEVEDLDHRAGALGAGGPERDRSPVQRSVVSHRRQLAQQVRGARGGTQLRDPDGA